MIVRLSEYDIELLLFRMAEEGKNILAPLKKFKNSYDFYKMYKKIIRLYDKTYQTRLIDTFASFHEKFEIVIVSAEQSKIANLQQEFINSICSIPFEDTESPFLNELKSDGLNLSYVAIHCLKFNQFTYAYNLLNYLAENIETLPVEDLEEFYCSIRFLLDYMDVIIDKNLSDNNVTNIQLLLIRDLVREIHYIYSTADNW